MSKDDYRGLGWIGVAIRNLYDAYKRDKYKKSIEKKSREAVKQVQTLAEQANKTIGKKSRRLKKKAIEIAKKAVEERNILRTNTQKKLSWPGRHFSEAVERPRNWKDIKSKLNQNGKNSKNFEFAKKVAESAGKSNKAMVFVQKSVKVGGWIAVGIGSVLTLKNVWDAPRGKKLKVLYQEAVSAGIFFTASSVGSVAGIKVLLIFFSAPPVLAVGLASIIGSVGFTWLANWTYQKFGKQLGGQDPFAALLGTLLGLIIGTAYGMQSAPVGIVGAYLPNCDCNNLTAGILTAPWREHCMSAEQKLLDLTKGARNEADVVLKLNLKQDGNGNVESGTCCLHLSGPNAWPRRRGPFVRPTGLSAGRGTNAPKPQPKGISQTVR